MKNSMKIAAFFAALTLLFMCGCTTDVDNSASNTGDSSTPEKAAYTFVMPDGAPSLAVTGLMQNHATIDGHSITYKIVPADNIATEFTSNADIALMPTNAAAKLFNKGVGLKLASVNVFGVLYMIGKTPLENGFADLKGKLVYNIGKGKTPDLLLKYFLTEANVEYVESAEAVDGKVALAYESEAAHVLAKLTQNTAAYGVMGQPVVTNANKKLGTTAVVDFQAEWKKLNDQKSYPQAGVAVKNAVAEDASFMTALYSCLLENGAYISENPTEIKGILARFNSALTFDFTADTVAACNIGCSSAKTEKSALEGYFTKIMQFDSTFIGGALPATGFYYGE